VARLWLGKPFDPKLDDLDQTVHTEHWLVQAGPQERLTRRMLTRSDGFRGDQQHPGTPAGTLEIEGDIAHYKVRHVAASGRWYGWNEGTLSLDPVASLSESTIAGDGFGCGFRRREWLWPSFSGSTTWVRESGQGLGSREKVEVRTDFFGTHRCRSYAYDAIPAVKLDKGLLKDGWSSTALGRCALDVDGSSGHGFVTFGDHGDRDDARFRVVLAAHTLLVEVNDDVFTGASASWVNDDHLEVWLGFEFDSWFPPFDTEQEHEDKLRSMQWGIRIADARVFPGAGKPTELLDAQRAVVDAHTVRLRIDLPEKFKTITVVYSDSDDGQKQKSLLATSRLVFDVGSSLGLPAPIDPARATCKVIGGKLEPVLTPPSNPDCPVMPEW
jgi:hypothetical protein